MVQQFIRTLRSLQVDFKPEAHSRWADPFCREQMTCGSFESAISDLLELRKQLPSGAAVSISPSSFLHSFEKTLESEDAANLCTAIMQIIRQDRDPRFNGEANPAKALLLCKMLEHIALLGDSQVLDYQSSVNAHYAVTELSRPLTPAWNAIEYLQFSESLRPIAINCLLRVKTNTSGPVSKLAAEHLIEAFLNLQAPHRSGSVYSHMWDIGELGSVPLALRTPPAGHITEETFEVNSLLLQVSPNDLYASLASFLDVSHLSLPHVWAVAAPDGTTIPRLHPSGIQAACFNLLGQVKTPQSLGILTRGMLSLIVPHIGGSFIASRNIGRVLPQVAESFESVAKSCRIPGKDLTRILLSHPKPMRLSEFVRHGEFEALVPFVLGAFIQTSQLVGRPPRSCENLFSLGYGSVMELWKRSGEGMPLPARLENFGIYIQILNETQPKGLATARDIAGLPDIGKIKQDMHDMARNSLLSRSNQMRIERQIAKRLRVR